MHSLNIETHFKGYFYQRTR